MSIFTGIPVATLQTWLSDAQTAMQELAIGKRAVTIAIGDKRLSFSPAELPRLKSYICQLQAAIAEATGAATGQPYSVATWTR